MIADDCLKIKKEEHKREKSRAVLVKIMTKKHLQNLVLKFFIVLAGVLLVHQFVQLSRNTDFILSETLGLRKISVKSVKKEQQKNVILLLTGYRTGSTLLGEMFSRHEEAFYMFEPDHVKLWDPSTQVNWLMQYFNCGFSGLSTSEIENKAVDWSAHRDFVFAHKSARLCKPPFCQVDYSNDPSKCMRCPKVDIALARQTCKRLTPVIKTVRTKDMDKLKAGFIENKLNAKVVINVRDPRAVLNSRKQLKELALVNVESIQNYCNYKVAQKRRVETDPWYAERTIFVKYEELALNAARETAKLTHANHGNDPYGTLRNASKTVDAWRSNLNSEEITLLKQIEEVCEKMMEIFKLRISRPNFRENNREMRIAFLLLATNVRSQEADEEEGPQIDPRALFMTQFQSMQGSLAIPFLMTGAANGQQSDYLQYLLLKTQNTCEAAKNALTLMMMTTSDDVVPIMPLIMTKLGGSSQKLSMFYLMSRMSRRVVDRFGRISTVGIDMQTIMIYKDLREQCSSSETSSSNNTPESITSTTTSIAPTTVFPAGHPLG
ncbi:unnamed protein product [Oikopleura dioica]|uniref:Sulfotransferase n=1 Tax=Oikopleura dioica TaxID=34765 RepID=E4XZ47_OIKDI|nr:unnamed protein product [Oikopleura dioica]